MDEAKIEEKAEKSLKKMHKVVQFFTRLVEGEDDLAEADRQARKIREERR